MEDPNSQIATPKTPSNASGVSPHVISDEDYAVLLSQRGSENSLKIQLYDVQSLIKYHESQKAAIDNEISALEHRQGELEEKLAEVTAGLRQEAHRILSQFGLENTPVNISEESPHTITEITPEMFQAQGS